MTCHERTTAVGSVLDGQDLCRSIHICKCLENPLVKVQYYEVSPGRCHIHNHIPKICSPSHSRSFPLPIPWLLSSWNDGDEHQRVSDRRTNQGVHCTAKTQVIYFVLVRIGFSFTLDFSIVLLLTVHVTPLISVRATWISNLQLVNLLHLMRCQTSRTRAGAAVVLLRPWSHLWSPGRLPLVIQTHGHGSATHPP